ncbi:MAG: hypothetical protein GY835_16585 [bacterium]|nr:hypothetical protein [bacterium]
MPKTTFMISVEVKIAREGANINEILEAVGEAHSKLGVQLAEGVIEWLQEDVRNRLCRADRQAKKSLGRHSDKRSPPRRCRCRSFVKEGFRQHKRRLATDLGEIGFRVGRVSCRRCGGKFAPILDVLGLQRCQGHSAQLERIAAEATCRTSFARSVAEVDGLAGVPVSGSSSHRWVASLDLPVAKPPPLEMLLADGTAYKKAGGRRGELRIAVGVTETGKIIPLGTWSGVDWRTIGKSVRRRLRNKKAKIAVLDGEPGLDFHFAKLANCTQRSHWHLLRDLRILLWKDGLKAAQTKPLSVRLRGILGVEIPAGEWEAILPVTKDTLRGQVKEAREAFQAMIDEFGAFGYTHGQRYLEGARDRLFSRIDLWMQTGIIAPRSTGLLEEIMRETGRRIKKLGWNWKDHGVTQEVAMILLQRYSPDQWDAYWRHRLDLQGRCRLRITRFECMN